MYQFHFKGNVCVCVWKPCNSTTKPRDFAKHSLNTSVVEYDTKESESECFHMEGRRLR